IANAGTEYVPHVLKMQNPVIKATNILSSQNFDLIRQGMIEACSPGGVGYTFFNFTVKNPSLQINNQDIFPAPEASTSANFGDFRRIQVACKTGTAQEGGDTALPHAWMTLFAPAYHPQVVVTVLAESAGEGSEISGPVATEILKDFFEEK
ncbi:MAG TPA: penicillin-binding transpeptidase domain-containing protein, partial [Candidatus Saccharimonadales bacterium]|nr:penicillin-binding transpeptidase domain-containing protein [Candidatus Saccharimonadales bacterium]